MPTCLSKLAHNHGEEAVQCADQTAGHGTHSAPCAECPGGTVRWVGGEPDDES